MRKPDLFLLHFAGGNIFSFNFLKPYLDDKFNFQPIELPGRGDRIDEQLLLEKDKAIDDIVEQILKKKKSKKVVIYGHSMGAILGFLVINKLEKLGENIFGFIATGNPGPNIPLGVKRYLLPKKSFIEELEKLGGIDLEIIENDELFSFLEPIIRADFELIEKEKEKDIEKVKINCPIHASMGDNEINSNQIENWRFFTNSQFNYKLFSGGHFFVHDYPVEIASIIKRMVVN